MRKVLLASLFAVSVPAFAQTAPSDVAQIADVARSLPVLYSYEAGTMLDGLASNWQATADGRDFSAIKAAVDKWVDKDGNLTPEKPFKPEAHSLDNLEPGRAIVLMYRVTGDARYYKAAKFLYEKFADQPRTPEGGYWHKQIYPQQMWLDGAYMGEPFRAAYAATFQDTAAFDDIAKQLLLMHDHLRDPKTGLLRHGWDSAKAQPWADKTTGQSPEAWARAVGWYGMALADTLPWFPENHPARAKLIAVYADVAASIAKTQDRSTGLWPDVLSQPKKAGNFPEASASAMFVYMLAKGVRLGYLPASYQSTAIKGWQGIGAKFVKREGGKAVAFTGTVKVSGLGGTPYRSGDYDYYIHEATGDNDQKGLGAYLLAASEMGQAREATLGRGKTVLIDGWFNSQVRKNAAGQDELFHYKWNDDANSGFAFFGRAFQRYGGKLGALPAAPTAANLEGASVYVIASPDNPSKVAKPHYMDEASASAVEAWVRAGGTLLLMENDPANADIEHFNMLSERFGVHYNSVLRNTVEGHHYEQGQLNLTKNEVFPAPLQVYMKEICTIKPSGPAKAIFTDKGDVLMTVTRLGKGVVYATVDPWLYNEYVDGRKLQTEFQNYDAAIALARWALRQHTNAPATPPVGADDVTGAFESAPRADRDGGEPAHRDPGVH